ncbi:MAG: hypothetical protein KatS3mg097_199 [Candidatus Parcubacteria bacterium]|nr:MAG: hypothetical protein KatS3mg097_199 [Candidatus Parcubacteria bacterium]
MDEVWDTLKKIVLLLLLIYVIIVVVETDFLLRILDIKFFDINLRRYLLIIFNLE